jgi:hypothetical protein
MTLRALFSLFMAAFVVASGSGCLTFNLSGFAGQKSRPLYDDLATVDAAWLGNGKLVVAMTGYMARSADNWVEYEAPFWGAPQPWWFVVDMTTPRSHDFLRNWTVYRIRLDGSPPEPDGFLAPRSTLASGVPPPEALVGLKPIPVVDVTWSKSRVRNKVFREAVATANPALIRLAKSEEKLSGFGSALTLHFADRDAATGKPGVVKVALEPLVHPPQTWAWIFLPVTLAIDIPVTAAIMVAYLPFYAFRGIQLALYGDPRPSYDSRGNRIPDGEKKSEPAGGAAPATTEEVAPPEGPRPAGR